MVTRWPNTITILVFLVTTHPILLLTRIKIPQASWVWVKQIIFKQIIIGSICYNIQNVTTFLLKCVSHSSFCTKLDPSFLNSKFENCYNEVSLVQLVNQSWAFCLIGFVYPIFWIVSLYYSHWFVVLLY